MRALFLDFDGVLNTPATWGAARRGERIDRHRVALLAQLCAEHDVRIVVTSAWRIGADVEDLDALLVSRGLPPGTVIGKTGWVDGPRSAEIRHYLRTFDGWHGPLTSFAIVDDDAGAGIAHRYVWTDPEEGLIPSTVRRLTKILLTPLDANERGAYMPTANQQDAEDAMEKLERVMDRSAMTGSTRMFCESILAQWDERGTLTEGQLDRLTQILREQGGR